MKKLWAKFLSVVAFGILSVWGLVTFAQNTPSGFWDPTSTTNIQVGGWTGTAANDSLINVIRTFVNWALGMLALIALIVLLYGGFQMVIAAGDEGKYKNGFKILQQAAIGLVFIGVSWLVVSLIFWVLGTVLWIA